MPSTYPAAEERRESVKVRGEITSMVEHVLGIHCSMILPQIDNFLYNHSPYPSLFLLKRLRLKGVSTFLLYVVAPIV